ncbi:MAG: putative acetyltransferase [Pseudonocardiales bacterium]|nr:putative acetyltransferase [Pseudonocardiales bacterium]
MTASTDLVVKDNPDAQRYEAYLAGEQIGVADYRLRDNKMIIPHTEIDPRHGGNGYGGQMVRFALDDVRARGLRVVPSCPFVGDYIKRNPEYADLL